MPKQYMLSWRELEKQAFLKKTQRFRPETLENIRNNSLFFGAGLGARSAAQAIKCFGLPRDHVLGSPHSGYAYPACAPGWPTGLDPP